MLYEDNLDSHLVGPLFPVAFSASGDRCLTVTSFIILPGNRFKHLTTIDDCEGAQPGHDRRD